MRCWEPALPNHLVFMQALGRKTYFETYGLMGFGSVVCALPELEICLQCTCWYLCKWKINSILFYFILQRWLLMIE